MVVGPPVARGRLGAVESERVPVATMLRVAAVFIIGLLALVVVVILFLAGRGG